jgi:hypothetical protein
LSRSECEITGRLPCLRLRLAAAAAVAAAAAAAADSDSALYRDTGGPGPSLRLYLAAAGRAAGAGLRPLVGGARRGGVAPGRRRCHWPAGIDRGELQVFFLGHSSSFRYQLLSRSSPTWHGQIWLVCLSSSSLSRRDRPVVKPASARPAI